MAAVLAMAVGVLVGAWIAASLGGGAPAWAAATTTMGVGTVLALGARRSALRPRAWVVGALALTAALGGASAIAEARVEPELPRGVASIEGEVIELRAGRDRADAIVRIGGARPVGEGSRAPPIGARVRMRGSALVEGTLVAGTVALAPVPGFHNPTPHPPWPLLDPVRADARPIALAQRSEGSWIGRVRAHVRAALVGTLDEPACGVARALVLGDLALDDDGNAAVRGAGLSHVLAVSGMHVTLLVGALVWLLRRAILRIEWIAARIEAGRVACAIGIPLALVYAPLAGGSPSAWRAALTAALAWSLCAIGRRPDPIAVTAGSVIAFAIGDPEGLVRPGFLLSIAATAAILAPIEDADERPVRALLIASVRATIATAPIVIWCFEGVAITGVIANVVVVPIASAVLLPLAAVHALLASISEPLSIVTAAALDVSARGFLAACDALATPAWGRTLPPLDVAQGIALGLACAGVLVARSVRQQALVLALAALALAGAELRLRIVEQPRGVLRATFLDVGQGDGALIDLPDGRLMLVDAGGAVGAGIDPGAAAIVPLLRARRRERIDVAVITHPHPDHYGGMRALLEALEVGEIWDTGQGEDETPEGELTEILQDARARGARVRRPDDLCEGVHRSGAARIEVLAPCPRFDPGWDPNDNSLVLRITLGARTLLLTGDVEAHEESALVASGVLGPVDLLKVGHHGSRTSSTPAFLAALDPEIAIVSAGRGNRFGHPHDDVLARLDARARRVVRIDREGGAIVETDGRALEVRSWGGPATDHGTSRSRHVPLTERRSRAARGAGRPSSRWRPP